MLNDDPVDLTTLDGREIIGPTPAGGDKAVFQVMDDDTAEIVEYSDGEEITRNYITLNKVADDDNS